MHCESGCAPLAANSRDGENRFTRSGVRRPPPRADQHVMASPGPLRRLSVLALVALATLAAAPAASASHTAAVTGSRPAWATPANHRRNAAPASKVVFTVWIGWRDQAVLDQLLADQQNPASPAYRTWLT